MRNKNIKIVISGYLDNNIGDGLMTKLLLKNFPKQQFYHYTNKTIIKNTFKGFENLKICDLSSEKEDLKEVDIYLRIDGSIFQIQSIMQNIRRRINLCKLRGIKRSKTHIVVLGSNFDSKYKRSALKTVQKEIKLNSLTVVRDEHSYEMLKGFKRIKNYHLAYDIAYNLSEFYPIKD